MERINTITKPSSWVIVNVTCISIFLFFKYLEVCRPIPFKLFTFLNINSFTIEWDVKAIDDFSNLKSSNGPFRYLYKIQE